MPPMSSTDTTFTPPTNAQRRADETEFYRRILHDIIQMGADILRVLHWQATQPDLNPTAAAPDPSVAFDRVARAVRRTVALARKLDEPIAPPRAASTARTPPNAVERRTDEEPGEAGAAAERERLADPADVADPVDDPMQRPMAEIVDEISRDIGAVDEAGIPTWRRHLVTDPEPAPDEPSSQNASHQSWTPPGAPAQPPARPRPSPPHTGADPPNV